MFVRAKVKDTDEIIYIACAHFYTGVDKKDRVEGIKTFRNGVPIPAFGDKPAMNNRIGITLLLESISYTVITWDHIEKEDF